MTNKINKYQVEEAREDLLKLLNRDDTIYFVIRSIAKSGMSKRLSLFIPTIDKQGQPSILDITWKVGAVLGYPVDREHTFRVTGVGTSVTNDTTINLSIELWGMGAEYKLKARTL